MSCRLILVYILPPFSENPGSAIANDHPMIMGLQNQMLRFDCEPLQQDPALVTLLVRHLPEAIPHDILFRLFSHYSAFSVRPCAGGRLRNCAFVDFKDEAAASQAQSQLNRLRFLGKVLSVERAGKAMPESNSQQIEGQLWKDISTPAGLTKDAPLAGDPPKESIGSSCLMSEAIAPKLGVDYPFPPHLEYAYPPPDGNILTNIVNALIAVPRFYIQALHLMNKMNLPAPFRMALPTPPLPPQVMFQPPPPSSPPPPLPVVPSPHLEDLSSDESELESPEERDVNVESHLGSVRPRKRCRRQIIVGPAVDKGVAHEAVGLKPGTLVPKEIPVIKKKNTVLQIKIAPKSLQNENKHQESSKDEKNEPAYEVLGEKLFATPEEIEAGKLPAEEILSLSMFKNYNAGNPATVLYIKNLAKDVVVEDFYFIFGSLFGDSEAAKSDLNVKLMQEGRMRGQAFVTFPSIDLANKALDLVHGYVCKGKPMIVQFGRNPPTISKLN